MIEISESFTKCCFTGYRPNKFPFKLERADSEFRKFEDDLFEFILRLAATGCRTFYCGMAMGFDLLAADSVLSVKNAFLEPIKLICVLPFERQSDGFYPPWDELFEKVLKNADETVVMSEKYFKGCYQKRNEFMVDNSDYVITWYDGQKGGTANTIRYACKKGRQVFNINEASKDDFGIQIQFEVL